jgi:hypothetical protein
MSVVVACPYFYPTEKSSSIAWAFSHRLPLGAGYCGTCTAGQNRLVPEDAQLRDLCNLGNARHCARLPADRRSDAVRFAVARDSGQLIVLHYSCERDHAPQEFGQLEYSCASRAWKTPHADSCIQRQAECYLASYMEKRTRGKS